MPTETVFEAQPAENQDDANILNVQIEENKKKGVDELAKGKAHADQFIEFLKEQNAAMKAELDKALIEANKRKSAEEVLQELQTRQSVKGVVENPEEPTSSSLNSDAIKSLVKESISEENQKAVLQTNVQVVDKVIRDKFGDKAKEFIANKAIELGLTIPELGALAAKSPAGFFNLVGLASEPKTPAPTKSTIIPNVQLSTQPTPGTAAYYENLRKTNKVLFFSPAVQAQLFRDRERLGLDYYK